MPIKSYFKFIALVVALQCTWSVSTAQFSTCDTNLINAYLNPAGYKRVYVPTQPCSMYFYSTTTMSGINAHRSASNLGIPQLIINNAQENTDLTNELWNQGAFSIYPAVWLGITDSSTIYSWRTFSGGTVPFYNWASGDPNNQAPSCKVGGSCAFCFGVDNYWCQYGEDCAIMQASGQWLDNTCNGSGINRVAVLEINTCPVITKPADASICPGGSATLTTSIVSGGTPPYTYTWNPGGLTGPSVTVSPSTTSTYTVQASDRFACKVDSTATVTVAGAALNPTISVSQPSTCVGANDTVSLSSVSGTATYSWSWNGATVVSGSNGGPYIINWGTNGTKSISVTVTEGTCTGQANSTVTVGSANAAFTLNPSANVCTSGNVTATLSSAVSGTALYTWNFNGANVTSGTTGGPYSINWSTAGSKTVTLKVTDNGCSDSTAVPITISNGATAGISFSPTSGCVNSPVTISFTGSASGSAIYTWSFNGGTIMSGSNGGPYSIDWNSPGTKTVFVTVTDGGCSAQSSNTITINAASAAFALSPSTSACTGQNVTATLSSAVSGSATYNWNFNGANVVSGTTGGPYTINWPSAGPETVSLIVNENGCADTVSHTITIGNASTPAFSFSQTSGCVGQLVSITYSGTVSPTATYTWNFDGGTILSGTGAGPYSISWGAGGTKAIALTVTDGTCTGQTTNNFTVNSVSAAFGLNPAGPVCTGQNVTATLSAPASGTATYTWNFNGANVVSGTTGGPYSINWSSAGTQTVSLIVNDNGCADTTANTIVVSSSLSPAFTLSTTSTCSGQNVTVTLSGTASGTASYNWNFNGANITSGSGAGPYSINWTTGGTPNVDLTVTDGGCTGSASQSVTVNPSPQAITGTNNIICSGGALALGSPPAAGSTYHWSPGAYFNDSTFSNPLFHFSNTTTGAVTQTVTLTVDSAGCSTTALQSITVNPPAATTITPAGPTSFCNGGSVILQDLDPTHRTYLWSTGETTSSITVSTANTYSLTATDGNGCEFVSTPSVKVTVYQNPTVAIASGGQVNESCYGMHDGQLTVTATGGSPLYQYSWGTNPSQTGPVAGGLAPGSYDVTVIDSHGCRDTATYHILAANYIGFKIDSLHDVSCYQGSDGAVFLSPIGTPVAGSLLWSNGRTDTALTGLKGDTLSVTFTDASGCIADTTITIAEPPKIKITPTGDLHIAYGESTRLDVSITPTSSYFYTWSPGTSLTCTDCAAPTASPIYTTAYTLSVVDVAGCQATDTITVFVDPAKSFYIPNVFTPNNDGKNDLFMVYTSGSVKFFELTVFNRWGEKVYDSNDIFRGWDGTYKGIQVNPGSYVYQATITFLDGETFHNNGSVTVLR
jgi:gliding motility-associated-like protein